MFKILILALAAASCGNSASLSKKLVRLFSAESRLTFDRFVDITIEEVGKELSNSGALKNLTLNLQKPERHLNLTAGMIEGLQSVKRNGTTRVIGLEDHNPKQEGKLLAVLEIPVVFNKLKATYSYNAKYLSLSEKNILALSLNDAKAKVQLTLDLKEEGGNILFRNCTVPSVDGVDFVYKGPHGDIFKENFKSLEPKVKEYISNDLERYIKNALKHVIN